MSSQVIEGTVNFSNVTQHDVYNGQSTGAYSITITMSEDDASALSSNGVKIKDYEGNKQRKFKSKYDIAPVSYTHLRAHETREAQHIQYTVRPRIWKRSRF